MTSTTSTVSFIDTVVRLYGDLLFDLCESVLWSPSQTQNAFRAILKEIGNQNEHYKENERAWILRIAFQKLKELSVIHARKVTSSEQIEIEANPSVATRLKHFPLYFHRLTTEEQIVLLLRDKYGLPYDEVATSTGLPEGTIKSVRQQALRTLEGWLWPEGE